MNDPDPADLALAVTDPPELPAGQLAALHDLTVLLEGYERLDAQAGLRAQVRPDRERLHHLVQLVRMLEHPRSPRPLLLAIAAQTIQWAATLEHGTERDR